MRDKQEIIPEGPPLMRRRDVQELGLSRATIRKLEESGALKRVFPLRNGHGYYIRAQVKSVIIQGMRR